MNQPGQPVSSCYESLPVTLDDQLPSLTVLKAGDRPSGAIRGLEVELLTLRKINFDQANEPSYSSYMTCLLIESHFKAVTGSTAKVGAATKEGG